MFLKNSKKGAIFFVVSPHGLTFSTPWKEGVGGG